MGMIADPAHLPSQSLYEQPPVGSRLPRESCEDAQVACRHASAEGRAAERALGQHKNRKWQQYLINCTPCTVSKEQNYRATGPFLCALPCSRAFLFPWVRRFCWVWASLGCTCCGDSLIHLLGRDALFAHWKDKLLILFSVILSQREKAHLTGLT